jgi:hypothetical protein
MIIGVNLKMIRNVVLLKNILCFLRIRIRFHFKQIRNPTFFLNVNKDQIPNPNKILIP